jgi:hypothetical protein
VAFTDCAFVIRTAHGFFPEHAPVHFTKCQPFAGCSFSWTLVPWGNRAEQVFGQAIPAGVLVTEPLPFSATLSVWGGAGVVNVWSWPTEVPSEFVPTAR